MFLFSVVEREEKGPKKLYLEFLVLGCFGPKMAVSWRKSVFQKMGCWNPYFYSVFGGALFGPSCQKRDILDTHQERKMWLITEKFFGVFLCLFSFCFLFFVFIVLGGLCFFWGFKGQVSWPKGPPHLALKPPYCNFCLFLFPWLLIQKGSFSPKTGHFCLYFSVSLCFSLAFSLASPFLIFSFSVSLLLFSFFLPSCLSFCFLLVPCFCLFLYFSFVLAFHEKNNIKIFYYIDILHQSFLLFLVVCLVSLSNPFLLSLCFFLDFMLCFLVQCFLVSKKTR